MARVEHEDKYAEFRSTLQSIPDGEQVTVEVTEEAFNSYATRLRIEARQLGHKAEVYYVGGKALVSLRPIITQGGILPKFSAGQTRADSTYISTENESNSVQEVSFTPTPAKRKPGGRRLNSESNGEDDFILQPVFTEAERELIKLQWEREKLKKLEKAHSAQIEEQRIQAMSESIRSKSLVDTYEQILPKQNQGISLSLISSADDIILLLRYAVEKGYLSSSSSSYQSLLDAEILRQQVINIEEQDLANIKLLSPLDKFFGSYQGALIAAYPKLDIQFVEFRKVPRRYWQSDESKERCKEAIRWLAEDKIGITKEDPLTFRERILNELSQTTLSEYGISVALRTCGYRTTAEAIIDSYPELKMHAWEFKKGSSWKGEEGNREVRNAVRWLIEERFGIQKDEPNFRGKIVRIKAQHFIKNGLGGMLVSSDIKSHIAAVIYAYPELGLKEEEFSRFPSNFWTGKNAQQKAISYTRNLFDRIWGLDLQDPKFRENLLETSRQVFEENGLGGMIASVFKGSVHGAVLAAYPELDLKEWEFSKVPANFWPQNHFENVRLATIWMVGQRLQADPTSPDFRERVLNITQNDFKEAGLDGMMLSTGLPILRILQITYPELKISPEAFINARPQRTRTLITQEDTHDLPKEVIEEEVYRIMGWQK